MAEKIKLRAERRAGGLLEEQNLKVGRPSLKKYYQADTIILTPTLKEQEITHVQSSHWQHIANIPEDI